jgi:hypothetical protein
MMKQKWELELRVRVRFEREKKWSLEMVGFDCEMACGEGQACELG